MCADWPGSKLSWKPTSATGCTPPGKWDAMAFCKALGKRRMHIMGDSTMFQIAATLINRIVLDASMIAQQDNRECAVPTRGNHSVSQQRLLQCAGQLSFATVDTLIGRNLGYFNRGEHWTQEVRAQRLGDGPSIVIFGANAHLGRGVDYPQFLTEVAAGIPSFMNITFFWATSVPGGCAFRATESPPGAGPRSWEATMNSSYDDNSTQNYPEFYSRDWLAIRFWAGTHIRIINLLDLHLRPDAHPGSFLSETGSRDCLHMCIPGPLDSIVPRQVLHALVHEPRLIGPLDARVGAHNS